MEYIEKFGKSEWKFDMGEKEWYSGGKDKSITILIMGLLDRILKRGPSVYDLIKQPQLSPIDYVIKNAEDYIVIVNDRYNGRFDYIGEIERNLYTMDGRDDIEYVFEKQKHGRNNSVHRMRRHDSMSPINTSSSSDVPYERKHKDRRVNGHVRDRIVEELGKMMILFEKYNEYGASLKDLIKRCRDHSASGVNGKGNNEISTTMRERVLDTQAPLKFDKELTELINCIRLQSNTLEITKGELEKVAKICSTLQSNFLYPDFSGGTTKARDERLRKNHEVLSMFMMSPEEKAQYQPPQPQKSSFRLW